MHEKEIKQWIRLKLAACVIRYAKDFFQNHPWYNIQTPFYRNLNSYSF